MANIKLNLLPLNKSGFSFKVFRKIKKEEKPKEEDLFLYSLKKTSQEEKERYWISFSKRDDFEEYIATSYESIDLTKKFISRQLYDKSKYTTQLYPIGFVKTFIEDRIEFTIDKNNKGRKIIFLCPYYLEEQRKFGFLIDFKFSKLDGVPFDKEVQKLSLSLDEHGRSEKNYYSKKYHIIQTFLSKVFNSIKLISSNEQIEILNQFVQSPNFKLNKKEFIFKNKNTSYSQFQGIKNFGPYSPINKEVVFVFIFEERFKSFANELYLSLVGKSNPGTFPGMEQMFKVHLGIDNVKQIKVADYSRSELIRVIQEISFLKGSIPKRKVIGIFIEDYEVGHDVNGSSNYHFLKYNFIKRDIPLQVINYRSLGEKNSLKWSTSNLALGIFSKLGGIPWIVKPSNNNCLILGIGSSHKFNPETRQIIKYFAYTVCLDSSGLYKSLEVLADEENNDNYLEKLQSNLMILLNSEKYQNYKSCVLHLPFKIKKSEIEALSKALKTINNIEFVAIKINLDNKFFGYSDHNTLVPYESSFIKLSNNEYLVWFEGLIPGREVVDKRLSNPVHIQFLNLTSNNFDERKYLQDVLNLSGANWRGFNAKSVPISIYYSQLIAKYTKAFEELNGYNENDISNEKPWFL